MLLYEEVIERQGGFGIYQFLLLFLQFLAVNYGNQLVFNNGFLTAIPKFKCYDKNEFNNEKEFIWYSCQREEICNDGKIYENIGYDFDREDPSYYKGYFE